MPDLSVTESVWRPSGRFAPEGDARRRRYLSATFNRSAFETARRLSAFTLENTYAERLIGSIRRECLDHIVMFGERHMHHVQLSYMDCYNGTRTHLSLNKNAPISRAAKASVLAVE